MNVPSTLNRASLWIWISPLIVASQTMLAQKLPWWKLDWSYFELHVSISVAVCFVLWLLLIRNIRGARTLAAGVGILWTLGSALLALRLDSSLLGLTTLGVGIFWFFYLDHLNEIYQLPYLEPGLRWYQSLPEPIPGLSCDLLFGEESKKGFAVSRISIEGVFVMGDNSPSMQKKMPSGAMLHYKGQNLSCPVHVITRLRENKGSESQGLGLQFKNKDRDFMKDLSDFVELLRGEGHVR